MARIVYIDIHAHDCGAGSQMELASETLSLSHCAQDRNRQVKAVLFHYGAESGWQRKSLKTPLGPLHAF